MSSVSAITAEEFVSKLPELPEAGRWHELHDGLPVLLSAPDDVHGTIVLNLTRALATWLQGQPVATRGYACPGIGLHVKSQPDTVYFPAMSLFKDGRPFSQFDRTIASEVPKLVIDLDGGGAGTATYTLSLPGVVYDANHFNNTTLKTIFGI